MKGKILNGLLILTSLIGYLEWGGGNNVFLFQAEAEVISKLIDDFTSVIHPLTILPLVGQLVLLVTLFQKKPSRMLTYVGIFGIGILLTLIAFIGIIGLNYKVLFSTIPFLFTAFLTIRYRRKKA